MTTFEDIWRKLAKSKKYREEFALSLLKRSVPFQVKTLRKKHCGSQAVLAERAKLTQGVVSRAEDQEYGNLTFNTIGRIAAGLDMAFIGKFVPFSEFTKFSLNLSEEEFATIPTFEEEFNGVTTAPTAHGDLDEGSIVGSARAVITGVCATTQAGQVSVAVGQVSASGEEQWKFQPESVRRAADLAYAG